MSPGISQGFWWAWVGVRCGLSESWAQGVRFRRCLAQTWQAWTFSDGRSEQWKVIPLWLGNGEQADTPIHCGPCRGNRASAPGSSPFYRHPLPSPAASWVLRLPPGFFRKLCLSQCWAGRVMCAGGVNRGEV